MKLSCSPRVIGLEKKGVLRVAGWEDLIPF